MPGSVEAYIFDLGNVIVDIHPERFLPELGINGTVTLEEALTKYEQSGLTREFELGNMSFDEFHEKSCELFGIQVPKDTFLKAWNAMIGTEKPGMDDIIAECSEKGPVYLLSNTNDPHYHDALSKAPSLQRMKRHYLSYKLNLLKPDPQIYVEVINHIGIPADKLFFTDDREDNIDSAKQVGLHTVRFQSPSQLKDRLQQID